MLTISHLNQFYGQSHTLWDINLHIKKGKITCLMGRNGVGKSTLAKAIMGLLALKSGEMRFLGVDLCKESVSARARLGIGYVPQGREIFPQLSVKENLHIGLLGNAKKPKRVDEKIYELFPILKTMQKRRGGDLSGGQQQQLAIARALCLEPKLLILDEPTEGIQPDIIEHIGKVIAYLKEEEGICVLLIEQKLPFARAFSDEFCLLDRGRIVAQDAISALDENLINQYLSV